MADIATVGEAIGEWKWSQEVFSMGGWCNSTPMNIRGQFFFTERRNILEKSVAYELSSVEEKKTTYVIL